MSAITSRISHTYFNGWFLGAATSKRRSTECFADQSPEDLTMGQMFHLDFPQFIPLPFEVLDEEDDTKARAMIEELYVEPLDNRVLCA